MRWSLAINDAQADRSADDLFQLARRAAAADPWSAEPHLQLARLHYERWYAQSGAPKSSADDFQAFQLHSAQAIRRNPRAYPTYAAVGYLEWEAAQRTGERPLLDDAVARVEQSVALYPNDALGRAQLAWLLAKAGSRPDAAHEAGEALRLDQLCPHAERKLAQRRLFAEVTSSEQQARMPDDLRTLNAEQWMHRLRKNFR
jgi:tetratricopeptide (TPR) repeat protein